MKKLTEKTIKYYDSVKQQLKLSFKHPENTGMQENEKSYIGIVLGVVSIILISGLVYGYFTGQIPEWLGLVGKRVTESIQ